MRTPLSKFMLALALSALALPVFAQQAKTIRIDDMPKLSKQHLLKKAPELSVRSADIKQSNSKPRDWAYFEVEYSVAAAKAGDGKWIDDLTISYFVMTQGLGDDGKPEYNRFTLTEHYWNVAKGAKHKAAVVLPPVAIERFGMPIAFGVEIEDGESDPVSKSSEGKAPADWWTNEKYTSQSSERDGYLVDRSKTLFQFVNPDDYETVK